MSAPNRFYWIAFLFAVLALLHGSSGFLQAQTWARAFGGTSGDTATCVRQTSDGGFIVAGGSFSFAAETQDMWILKLDASGGIEWEQRYGGGANEYAQSIQQTLDGGYIVAGNRRTSGPLGKTHIWLLRLDGSGTVVWKNLYAGASNDFVSSVQETLDGGFIIGGYTSSFGASDNDLWIFKVDSSGTVVWEKRYGDAGRDQAFAVRETSDGGYVAIGFTASFATSEDVLIVKLDSSGNVLWANTYGDANNEEGLSIQQTADGGYVAVGYLVTNLGDSDLWAFKVNSSGTMVWQKSYGGSLDDSANSVALSIDGGFIVAGGTNSFSTINQGWLLKLSSSGSLLWQNTYGITTGSSISGELLASVQQTSDGGIVAAGSTDSFGAGSDDFWVLKMDGVGAIDAACAFISSPTITEDNPTVSGAPQTLSSTPTSATVSVLDPTVAPSIATVSEQCSNCAADGYEPDNDVFTAGAVLHGGESQTHNFCDTDTDWISFSTCAGRTYTIQTSALGASADTTMELYKQDGATLIASDDNGGGGLTSRIVWTSPSEGTAHVKILQTDRTSGKNRNYNISLTGNTSGCATWARNFGGNGADSAFSVHQSPDGRFVATGSTASFGAGSSDLWTTRVDLSGNLVLEKTYGAVGVDSGKSIQRTAGGGLIVAGSSNSAPAVGNDAWILSLDSAGAVLWQKVYGGTLEDEVVSIQQTADGGYISAGDTTSFGAGLEDFFVIRLDSSGTPVWFKTFGGAGSDVASSISQTRDGGFVVAGSTGSYGAGAKDFWVLKLDTAGKIVWQKTYGGSGDDLCNSVRQTTDGGYFVAGSTTGATVDALILRLDPMGAVIWKKTYGGANTDTAQSIQQTSDGGFIFAGKTASQGAGMNDFWVLRGNAQGGIVWQKAYGGSNDETASAVEQIADGGYVVTGSTATFHAGANDFWLLKLDPNGVITASCANAATTTLTSAASSAGVNFSTATGPSVSITTTNTVVTGSTTVATSASQCFQHLPLEVSGSGTAQPFRFTTKTAVQWESGTANYASTFCLYSGTTPDFALGNFGTCLQSSIATNSTTLSDGNPAAGVCRYYIVSGKNVVGEGPLGNSSNGNARPNNFPCP